MNTNISKLYLDMITDLARTFAQTRSGSYPKNYQKKVYNSTFEVYYNIGVYLYIRLIKISGNKLKFSYNHIDSVLLKRFSCKLYKHILDDLILHKIIVRNDHYLHNKKYGFSKSFLIHRNIFHKINDSKCRLNYELINIEVPQKIIDITGYSSVDNEDDFSNITKLNRFNGNKQIRKIWNLDYYYNQLSFDPKSFNDYCQDDDFLYIHYWKKLQHLQDDPKFIKERWYHAFHEFPKDFRESVLRFEGENLKEIFDVTACDLHMLAKIVEKENIPVRELKEFQNEVKSDFRKKFGVRKRDGKCTAYVKNAFKIYMNSKRSFYDNIRYGSICWRIDQYFQMNFPTIREYLVNHDKFWQEMMKYEFETVSTGMFKELQHRGIKSFTVHDAIYVKRSVDVQDIQQIFYNSLNLLVDIEEKFDKMFS